MSENTATTTETAGSQPQTTPQAQADIDASENAKQPSKDTASIDFKKYLITGVKVAIVVGIGYAAYKYFK